MLDWSPEQVSGWLIIQCPKDESLRVSYETIYRSLFIQAREVLKKELIGHLRSKRLIRRSQHSSKSGHSKGQIVEAILIQERPAEVEDRAVPSKETTVVVAALSRHIRQLTVSPRRSLTWDRGHEMAQHKAFSLATDMKVYFCDPHSPWQRGTNENTNRLLRQYVPYRTDLSLHTQSDLDKIALRLNQRPRKPLGFEPPVNCKQVLRTRTTSKTSGKKSCSARPFRVCRGCIKI